MTIKSIAILRLNNLISFDIIQSREVLIIDILDVDPLNLEVSFELQCMVLPPKGESFFVICRFESSYTFEHAALHRAKEQVGVRIIINFSLPELFDLAFILWSGCPNAVLNSLSK